MTIYVLDSSAVLRYVEASAGAEIIEDILVACVTNQAAVCVSAVQWGEIAGRLRQRFGERDEMRILSSLLPSEATIVSVSGERAVKAAGLKIDRKIGYADAFALELAMESPDRVLVTADYGFKAVDDLAQIEFLPAK